MENTFVRKKPVLVMSYYMSSKSAMRQNWEPSRFVHTKEVRRSVHGEEAMTGETCWRTTGGFRLHRRKVREKLSMIARGSSKSRAGVGTAGS